MFVATAVRPANPRPPIWPAAGRSSDISDSSVGRVEELRALQTLGTKLRVPRNQTIFNQGDRAEHAYQVVSGVVRLCAHLADGRRQIARFLFPGDFFSLWEMREHSFTAQAVNNVVLLCYPQRQITRFGEERRGIQQHFVTLLSGYARDAQKHLMILGRQTAKERVASFLLFLDERVGSDDDGSLELPMGRQDIADYLGLTIETVCRVLCDMKGKNVIDIPNCHRIVLLNLAALQSLADGED